MEEIFSFDEIAKIIPRTIIGQQTISDINEVIRNAANIYAGDLNVEPHFELCFAALPKEGEFALRERVSLIQDLAEAGYKRIGCVAVDSEHIIDTFKLPLAINSVLPEVGEARQAECESKWWNKGGFCGE